jgi:hypothetical protein
LAANTTVIIAYGTTLWWRDLLMANQAFDHVMALSAWSGDLFTMTDQ